MKKVTAALSLLYDSISLQSKITGKQIIKHMFIFIYSFFFIEVGIYLITNAFFCQQLNCAFYGFVEFLSSTWVQMNAITDKQVIWAIKNVPVSPKFCIALLKQGF